MKVFSESPAFMPIGEAPLYEGFRGGTPKIFTLSLRNILYPQLIPYYVINSTAEGVNIVLSCFQKGVYIGIG